MLFKFHDTVYKNKNLIKENSADPNKIYMSEGKAFCLFRFTILMQKVALNYMTVLIPL